jgi:hypothetical protein
MNPRDDANALGKGWEYDAETERHLQKAGEKRDRQLGMAGIATGGEERVSFYPLQIQQEYEFSGLIQSTFALADRELAEGLKQDVERFAVEVKRNKQEGLSRTPYMITQSIMSVAHDLNILSAVSIVLGTDELVMWGPSIQRGTPDGAATWHTDSEAYKWPSVTVAVGIAGCREYNATVSLPGSHVFGVQPSDAVIDTSDDAAVLNAGMKLNPSSNRIISFSRFGDGRFYIFNAKTWHRGVPDASNGRELLFMHYQKAADPRIPYFKNYREDTWFDFPAIYMRINNGKNFEVSKEMYV